ncbi:MAG: hypothetical protein RLZZ605_1417 [Bacteroidota bacterium]|jgi:hypothetical protein
MEYQTINYLTVDLVIGFEVDGKHYPATRETPAEYPDIILKEVATLDSCINLLPILNEDQEEDIINILHDKL